MMAGIQHISEVMYHRVNQITGSQEEVKIRRDLWDIEDIIDNYIIRETHVMMTSGSTREGLNMKGSDFDYMIWFSDSHVICDISQIHLYAYTDNILSMEWQNTRPGFVLLQLFNQRGRFLTRQSLIQLFNHKLYISSFMFRNATQPYVTFLPNSTIHGPCISGFIGDEEFDFGLCFKSKHWPPQAYYWIDRCRTLCWPPPPVLRNIIQNGCHFMAIGAKNSPYELLEWRLSFSQAEQKLVYCMNQCQFLVYGLLKLFLKEVLNKGIPDDNKLLCSYFMKTALFWEIQQNFIMQWNAENFLSCFWSCYKCLIKWVYNEYCPNFFVPQNNIFYPKITGPPKQQLFNQMYGLYCEGFHCLLRCSSIHDQLYSALVLPQQPMINTCTFSEFDYDFVLHSVTVNLPSKLTKTIPKKSAHVQTLTFFINKLKSNISQTQRIIVYRHITLICQRLAFLLQTDSTHETNLENYKFKNQGLKLMKVTTKLGWVTSVLSLAMYHYNDGRYRCTLVLLQEAQSKLYRYYVMYMCVSERHYIQTLCGRSITTKMKEAWSCNVEIPVETKFPELRLELRIREKMKQSHLFVSPYVLMHFLSFLCYYHLHCEQQKQSLHELHTLVHWDDGRYINKDIKDIAWLMLGICHQLSAHPSQALACYREAQSYSPAHMLQQAALYRIYLLERYMYM